MPIFVKEILTASTSNFADANIREVDVDTVQIQFLVMPLFVKEMLTASNPISLMPILVKEMLIASKSNFADASTREEYVDTVKIQFL